MSTAFIQAAVILLREGLEAMLVIAALAGYLNKVGAGHRIQALYGGALTAVGASIIAAWLFAVLNSGEHSDILEGIIILVAAGLMLYVSGWLMVKQDPKGWKDYLAHKADTALAQDTVWAVGALAFLAVFREGAETVLFINALATAEGGWSGGLFAGLGVATLGLVVLFYFINLIAQNSAGSILVRRSNIIIGDKFTKCGFIIVVIGRLIKRSGALVDFFNRMNLLYIHPHLGGDF